MNVHNYGLGDATRTVLLSQADLQGQGTFAMENSEQDEGQKNPIEIREASEVVRNVTAGDEGLDHLHVKISF